MPSRCARWRQRARCDLRSRPLEHWETYELLSVSDRNERIRNSNALLPMTAIASAGAYLLSTPVELGPCTCTLRINTTGSPTDLHRSKKTWTRGLSGHPSGPLTSVDALEAG